MARITVEDCIPLIPNRFELVVIAAQRAREISIGESLTVERDNDKNPVVALREIADETVDLDELRQSLVRGLQKHVEPDEPEEDDMALLMTSEEWASVAQKVPEVEEEPAEEEPAAEAAATEADPGAADGGDESDDASKADKD